MNEKLKSNLFRRARMIGEIRRFLEAQNFLEVATPVIIDAPAPEEFIESITANNRGFLRSSPEIAMKILLSEGFEAIYQIGSCFRYGEFGRKHRDEFTMLEFYRRSIDYKELMQFAFELIRGCAMKLNGRPECVYKGEKIDFAAGLEVITVAEAFEKFSGMTAQKADELEIFDEIMVTKIEPQLGKGRLSALIDYPAGRASLSRLKPENPAVAERFELYIGGIELANAFGELTDLKEQQTRFIEAAAFRKSQNMLEYPVPERFFAALKKGLPECSGCALGLDRLAMIFCDSNDIAEVAVCRPDF